MTGSKWVEGAGGSEWDGRKDGEVYDEAKSGGGIQRVIGEDYLSKQLNILRIDKKTDWYTPKAAFCINADQQNIKCTIVFHKSMKLLSIHSEDFMSYSEYAGKIHFISTGPCSIDQLADNPEGIDIIEEETGWADYGCFTNFRAIKEKNDDGTKTIKRMIIDTEYNSFVYKGEPIFSAETIELLGGETFEFGASDLLG